MNDFFEPLKQRLPCYILHTCGWGTLRQFAKATHHTPLLKTMQIMDEYSACIKKFTPTNLWLGREKTMNPDQLAYHLYALDQNTHAPLATFFTRLMNTIAQHHDHYADVKSNNPLAMAFRIIHDPCAHYTPEVPGLLAAALCQLHKQDCTIPNTPYLGELLHKEKNLSLRLKKRPKGAFASLSTTSSRSSLDSLLHYNKHQNNLVMLCDYSPENSPHHYRSPRV